MEPQTAEPLNPWKGPRMAYNAMDDVSAVDAANYAGDELRAMTAAGLARALSGALAADLPADKVQRLNYYLQIAMGPDSMRRIAADMSYELKAY